jgi:hypothetical protein
MVYFQISGITNLKNLFFIGMAKPAGSTTERYKIKDFSENEIAQRLINVVSFSYTFEIMNKK